MTAGVKTGKVEGRRALHFNSLDEVLADLDRLEQAEASGSVKTLGNWSAGQVFTHLAMLFEMSLDGFTFTAPLPVRLMGPMLKKRVLSDREIPTGIQLRGGSAAALIPPDDVSFEQGMQRLRAVIGRVTGGEQMTHRSPVFGRLSHEEWTTLQLKHCALHLGFLIPNS